MIPLLHESHYTFRFGDDRIIPRFHLEGMMEGLRVRITRIETVNEVRSTMIATAIVGRDGWVDLAQPIRVRAGEGFVVEPDQGSASIKPD